MFEHVNQASSASAAILAPTTGQVLAAGCQVRALTPPSSTLLHRAFARGRHHCRLCGRIFCGACCAARLLLPPKFRAAEPARACSTCAALLEPLQPFLAGEQDSHGCSCLNPPQPCLNSESWCLTSLDVKAYSRRTGHRTSGCQLQLANTRGQQCHATKSVTDLLTRAGTISRAVQPAVRDVTDASCGHSWLNPPLGTGGLEGDIYKVRPGVST